ncbi:MAG: hypothetical protein IJ286_05410 [Alistipes sp.]|nr:hypothetical protein [Alistipes sp.]
MKRMMKLLTVVAVAAMGLTACQTGFEEQANVDNNVTVSFVAEQTRTTVDTSGSAPLFSWSDNETFAVLEQTDALAQATSVAYAKVDGKAKIDAQFPINADKGEYKYIAIYPANGYTAAENISNATLALPSAQSMAEGSYDPNADLMVSWPVVTAAQPTEAQYLRFTRLVAVAKMTINNLNLTEGEVVEKVEFTANGKALAGSIAANLENPHEFTVSEGVSSITVATNSASDVYFTTLPATFAAGDAYSVVVTTNKNTHTKQGVIPAEKSLVFEAGNVSRFSVNMADAVATEKWELVYDASSLKQGDVVAIVAKDYDMALSTKLYSNGSETATNTRRDATAITKSGNYLIVTEDVQQFILVDGAVENTFSFYDEARQKFLVSNNKSSRYLINQPYMDNNTSFNISIDSTNGDATVKNIEGDYKDCMIRYYNSSKYFYSGTSANQAITIYRRGGVVGEIPVVAANVTVPQSDEQVVIAEEGAQSATAIEDVVFNYVGDWAISATSDAQWLTLAYDKANNNLTYTAEANSGAVRTAVATITATLEGQQPLSWTFNVLQKGAPVEISIADFKTKGQDLNTVYKLTGILAEIPSSTSGKFKIEDENGNQVQVQYFKTEAGSYVKGNIDVKVGDVISLTTVVATTTAGLGGNSANPSIYKGHYSIAATASGSVEYQGGDVTISVEVVKNGHINAPTTISSAEVATDSNPISAYNFTDNGNGTATAVVSFSENTTGGSRKAELTFSAGSPLAVSTTVTVMQDVNPALKKGWFLVTDVNDLKAGDKIIIAATGLDYAISTATNTNNRKSTAITKVGSALENVSEDVQQYALEIDENNLYSFKGTLGTDAGKYIYAASSSNNYMKVSSTLDDNGKFAVAIASDGAATIIAQGTNTRNHMQYNNKSTSSPAFYCTDGSFGAVCLYKFYE